MDERAPTKRRAALAAALTGLLAAVCAVALANNQGTGPDATLDSSLLECRAAADAAQCRRDVLDRSYRDIGLTATLSTLETFFDNDWDGDGGSVFCHDVYHDLGTVAGENGGEGALVAGASKCEGGYYHGVLITNPALSPSVCSDLPYEDAFNCWHGAGHAAFSAQRDPTPSERPCPSEPNLDFLQICQQGYYMEYAHSTGWAVESLQFCLTADTNAVGNCLQPLVGAVVTTHPERVDDVLDVCARLPDGENLRACWRSAGFGIYSIADSRADFTVPDRCAANTYCREGLTEAEQWTPNG